MAKHNFSILCWNIDKHSDERMKDYICGNKADIYFFQEAVISQAGYEASEKYKTLYLEEKSTASTPQSSSPRSPPAVCNCIIYNSKAFEVYKVINSKEEVHCAIDEVAVNKLQLSSCRNKEIMSLKKFAEMDVDKRACVAILQCNSIPSKPKIIVVSCHVPAKPSLSESPFKASSEENNKKFHYAAKMLEALRNLSKETIYPLILGGDFNCDLLKEKYYEQISQLGYKISKYDPTIRRVVCSGGGYDKCIDYFVYCNCSDCVITKVYVSNVSADIVWPFYDLDFLDWDKCSLPQYQEHIKETSTLDKITKTFSRHDPLKATLSIMDRSLYLPIVYCDLENQTEWDINYFIRLNPQPELLIFQNVKNCEIIQNHLQCSLCEVTSNCAIAYNSLNINIITHFTKDNIPVCTIHWHGMMVFKLAVFFNGSGDETKVIKCFKNLSTEATPECPIILVGGFYLDLFREKDTRHGFEVPEYSPTMYRVTNTYAKDHHKRYICRDFFAFSNARSSRLTVYNVQAEMINPLPDLIRGLYNVNYNLIWNDKTIVLEALKATVSITPPHSSSNPASALESSTPKSATSRPTTTTHNKKASDVKSEKPVKSATSEPTGKKKTKSKIPVESATSEPKLKKEASDVKSKKPATPGPATTNNKKKPSNDPLRRSLKSEYESESD